MTELKLPATTEKIQEEMTKVFKEIKEETNWTEQRDPSELEIMIGEAPEYYESFGVRREKNKIIFGDWLDNVKPKYIQNSLWEFLIVRESFALFFVEDLLLGELAQLANFLLNVLAISFLKKKDEKKALEVKFTTIQSRFLLPPKQINNEEKAIYTKIASLLITIINKGVSYKTIFNTFNHFIEDIPYEDIDSDELLDDLSRYLSSSPEEIASPIRLKKNTTEVLMKLIEYGFGTSSKDIARDLGIDHSTVSKQLTKIASRFKAKWRIERNWAKLGLHTYLIIVRLPFDAEERLEGLSKELLKVRYMHALYQGRGKNYLYLYAVLHCPHVIADGIESKLHSFQKDGVINSFEIKPIKERIYRTAIVNEPFKLKISNFEKLLSGEVSCKKLILWETSKHKDQERELLEKNDERLLRFLSILISNSITKFGLYGVWVSELKEFLEEKGFNPNNVHECLVFLNELQNQVLERELITYRFIISFSGTATSNLLIVRILCDSKEKTVEKMVEELACFGLMFYLKSFEEIVLGTFGPPFDHPIASQLRKILTKKGFKCEIFSVQNIAWRFVPYHELYDFESSKWLIG